MFLHRLLILFMVNLVRWRVKWTISYSRLFMGSGGILTSCYLQLPKALFMSVHELGAEGEGGEEREGDATISMYEGWDRTARQYIEGF
ncbi:unnamed protein product [Lactuca saligna]|uniref:Uncharacterized protein n=1 Tax=Lactuca saligna TaxID=75948 RepID=A0AA35VKD5_LACSI|nr:unnamed protein product [Lactuca saligna]